MPWKPNWSWNVWLNQAAGMVEKKPNIFLKNTANQGNFKLEVGKQLAEEDEKIVKRLLTMFIDFELKWILYNPNFWDSEENNIYRRVQWIEKNMKKSNDIEYKVDSILAL